MPATLRQSFVSHLTRLYPFYSGCGTLANHPVVQRLAGASEEDRWTKVSGGVILAPMDDYVGRAAYYAGELDRKITWICRRLLKAGATALDIGANIGMVTVSMAALVGETGRVYSFEPNPALVRRLRQTIDRNGFQQVTLHPVALGPQECSLDLRVPKINAGSGSLVRNSDCSECATVSVPVKKLSDIGKEIDTVQLMKMDVEGYEAEVLKGGHEFLERVHPDAILFELNAHDGSKLSHHPVVRTLTECNYAFIRIEKSMVRMNLKRFDPTVDELVGNDILAIHRGSRYDDVMARLQ